MASPPPWIDIRQPSLPPDTALLQLGGGERETILLAHELHADLLLIDERDGRREAAQRSFAVVGTLRVLEMAAERGLLDLPTALTHLGETTFYKPENVVQDMLARDAARKHQQR
jgi:predicted nucleic acid-binding protein